MADEPMVLATRADVDDAVFGAAETVAGEMGLPRRERLKLTLEIANAVMFGIDQLSESAKRSEAAKRAAAVRYSKPKPTPGPAIPPPAVNVPQTAPGQPVAPGAMPTFTQMPPPSEPLAPPPHPALAPGATPFGAPPA